MKQCVFTKTVFWLASLLILLSCTLSAQEKPKSQADAHAATDKQAEPAKYPEISKDRKLNLRDIQLEYFGKEQQIKNINTQIDGLKAQINQLQQEEVQQVNPKWLAETEATIKEAGLDSKKVSIDMGTTGQAKDIKFASKPEEKK